MLCSMLCSAQPDMTRHSDLWHGRSYYLAEETGIRISDETVRRELAKEGIVFSRPQHTICSPDPEYQVKKRRLKIPETS